MTRIDVDAFNGNGDIGLRLESVAIDVGLYDPCNDVLHRRWIGITVDGGLGYIRVAQQLLHGTDIDVLLV